MSEFVSSWHFSERQQAARIEKVGDQALSIVDDTYGDGHPGYRRRGSHELAYHNGHHAREVGNTAFKLCTLSGLRPLASKTGRTAGYTHDLVQLKGCGVNERESAEWVEAELARGGLIAPPLRAMASLAIVGTEPLFEDGKLVGQKATIMDYPSKAAETMAHSVASADLAELYFPQGPLLAHQLFREINGMTHPDDLPMEKLAGFQRNQAALLESYRFPLPKAEKQLTRLKPQVIDYSTDLIGKIERGEIESWYDLMAHDLAFTRQYS